MNLQNQIDYMPSLLDGVIVPEGLDADIVKSNIMLECGLRTPLYSEPETMKNAISVWFASRSWTFEHLLMIVNSSYDPIANYDRHESYERSYDDTTDRTETLSGSDSNARTVVGDLIEKTDVSAFNDGAYQPSNRVTTDDDRAVTDELTYGKKNTIGDEYKRLEKYSGTTKGNIGVTTTQQMLQQEIDLLDRFNIYQWIAKQFAADLTLGVW